MLTILKQINKITPIVLAILLFASCSETERFAINADDTTPPGAPVFLGSTPLDGGARIFFQAPADEDVLAVEAAYTNTAGKTFRFQASYFSDSLDVVGFDSPGEQSVLFYAVDRAGNQSTKQTIIVNTSEPAVSLVAQTVYAAPSFGSLYIGWENRLRQYIYIHVEYEYTHAGESYKAERLFTSNLEEDVVSIDNLNLSEEDPIKVKVSVEDKFGNVAHTQDFSLTLLIDQRLYKSGWNILPAGIELGGITMGIDNMDIVIDGLTDADIAGNFAKWTTNPHNIIIDLGKEYELSRVVTHQRASSGVAYYEGENVKAYNMYIWDSESETWELLTRHDIIAPVVKQESELVELGNAGDMAYLYPKAPSFSNATRYFRYEAVNGKYLSEITLYGREPVGGGSGNKRITLLSPAPNASLMKMGLPTVFQWEKHQDVTDYTLKFSSDFAFPNDATLSIPVGNVANYSLTTENVAAMQYLFGGAFAGSVPFYWTVVPNIPTIGTQVRQLIALQRPHIISAAAPNVVDIRDFDLGGAGVAYYFSAGFWGDTYSDQYRRDRGDFGSPDVDIYADGSGAIVMYNDEWLTYTVWVEDAGNYQVSFGIATGVTGYIRFEIDGGTPVDVPYNQGDWGVFVPYQGVINLPAGEHRIRMIQGNGANIKGMTLTKQ